MLKKSFLMIVLCLFCFACSSSGTGENKLNGKWVIDEKALIEQLKAEGADQMGQEFMASMVAEMAKAVTVSFDVKNKEVQASFGTEKVSGKYTVVSDDGKVVKLSKDGDQMTFTFIDDNTLTMSEGPNDKNKLQLKKAQ